MKKQHHYSGKIVWTGNTGNGTESYQSYERSFQVHADMKAVIEGSSDPAFRGDATKYNPEELLIMSLASCHMLWYLHLCSAAGVNVQSYEDTATGVMTETSDGGGHFTKVVLNPVVKISDLNQKSTATELHDKAHELCFIANSVNFPVDVSPEII